MTIPDRREDNPAFCPDRCTHHHPDDRLDPPPRPVHQTEPEAPVHPQAGWLLKPACCCEIGVILLSIAFSLVPVVDVDSPWLFDLKVRLTALAVNAVGGAISWRGNRVKNREAALEAA